MIKILLGAVLLLNIQIAQAFSMRFMLLNMSQQIVATGGDISYVDSSGLNPRSTVPYQDGYTVHTFTNSTNFTVTSGGSGKPVTYLVIGGGGAGGLLGGGGSGGLRSGSSTIQNQTYPIIIGSGGTASGAVGNNGTDSSFNGIIGVGGGKGGSEGTVPSIGGSGGGGGAAAEVWLTEVFMPGALGTFEQGFSGGKGAYIRGPQDRMGGGGGGGSGGAGADGSSYFAGTGGAGFQSSISGVPTYYACGGGGGAYYYQNTGVYGTGGSNGTVGCGQGSDGGSHAKGAAEAGIAFTGSGGGGSGLTNLGTLPGSAGAGGSGVVIIRYKSR